MTTQMTVGQDITQETSGNEYNPENRLHNS